MATISVRRGWRVLLAGTLLGALAGGCDSEAEPDQATPGTGTAEQAAGQPALPGPVDGNPLAGGALFANPAHPAVTQVAAWEKADRAGDAAQLRKISERPVAEWLAGGTGVGARVEEIVGRAAAQRQVPVLVAYNVPDRDCGSYSAGGAASTTDYRAWIRAFAGGLKGRSAVVVLEPDAVAHTLEGCAANRDERYDLIRDAVTTLKGAGAKVYIDAGHPNWISDLTRLAGALTEAGIAEADGFALNVSNFVRTDDNVAYGTRLSDALGGKTRFVIDTSRNGAGPHPGGGPVNGGPGWCNPPGRALGPAPTVQPGRPRVDALLWVKRPGESDGACRPGEPAAGTWWPEYALDLAKRAG